MLSMYSCQLTDYVTHISLDELLLVPVGKRIKCRVQPNIVAFPWWVMERV